MRSARLRPLLISPAVFLLAGCEELQEAQPMSRTVPVALGLGVASVLCVLGLATFARWLVRRWGTEGTRFPRLTLILGVAPFVVPFVGLAVGLWTVAFGYRHMRYDMFSWEDSVGLWVVVAVAVAAVSVPVLALLAMIVSSGPRRTIGLVLVVAAIGSTATAGGLGVAWLPALCTALAPRAHRSQD